MPEVMVLPYELVNKYRGELMTTAGQVSLDQYMCKTASNGGNDNLTALYEKIRFAKDQGSGPTMNTVIGGREADIMLKGQGRPQDFVALWDFMLRNKELLKKAKISVYGRRQKPDYEVKHELDKGNVYDLYFKDRTESAALYKMVRDRFFGIDCIGFVANYMIFSGVWDKYYGHNIDQWGGSVFKTNVKKASDIKPLNILIWGGHIAIVDWVWGMIDDTTVDVDICQSSSSADCQGPQCNAHVHITEVKGAGAGGKKLFKILKDGSPQMPVKGQFSLWAKDGLFY